MKNLRLFVSFAAMLLALVASIAAWGQTSRGTLTGVVADAQGARVPNATVKITQQETKVSREGVTNAEGIYRFDAVDLGTYTVAVQASGFSTEEKTGVEITAAHTSDIDFDMKVENAKGEIITVEASNAEVQLQTSEQTRGQSFATQSISSLPLAGTDSLTLVQLLPGVMINGGNSINQQGTMAYSVNGQRPRGNNFMIDGVENNDISITGPAFTITNPDAVQEVNIQTGNFSPEFGRAGGAVFNQVTKSGTNAYHGTATEVYSGNVFKALNHTQRANGLTASPRDVQNIPDFTFGGPVYLPHLYNGHNKTFFFAGAQWNREFGTATSNNLRAPDDAGVALLQSIAGQCPNVALYLKALGSVRGNPSNSPSTISLAVPSAAGACTNSTRAGMNLTTGLTQRFATQQNLDANHVIRIDHVASEKQTLTFRWLYDNTSTTPSFNNLPGFDSQFTGKTMTGSFADTYVIGPTMTNEFRFNYGRIGFNFPLINASDPFFSTTPNYSFGSGISNLAGFGGATNIPQFRYANNWQYQDTVTKVVGAHTLRFGGDFLRQLAKQHPPFNERGSFLYTSSGSGAAAVTSFANFIDDFSGTSSATLNRQFGVSIYYPSLFRQSYFFEDSWKATTNLTINGGVRYENFGAPWNTFTVPAFTNYDPVNFAAPNKLDGRNTNFGPSLGLAWNPRGENWIDRLAGGEKMVWRMGYQRSFDTAFNNLLSNIAGSSPNTLGGTIVGPTAGRGAADWSGQFAGITASPATAQSAQSSLLLAPLKNPTTDRWSFGFQRELPGGFLMDTSYIGSVSHHLYRTIDMNPIVDPATGTRFQPQVGIRTVRAASANSNYESLQFTLRRGLKATPIGGFQMQGSYTYSHYLDDVSDVFSFDSFPSSFQSVSQVLGASPHIDYGNSDFDRRHVGVIGILWDVRGPKTGLLGSLVGGWQLAAISHWQTGIPFTVANGTDRNRDGQIGPDRPDIGNINAPLNTRAWINANCATGYSNPDANGACVDPNTVHWLQGTGVPNARTVGRNTLTGPGTDNLDLALSKRFRISESKSLEYRVDMFNALNTINLGGVGTLTSVPARTIFDNSVVKPGQTSPFVNFFNLDSIGRSMRMMLRFSF
jgi:hypothetical protein